MARWRMYIDDSASHGALLNKQFQRISTTDNGCQPITTAGGIIIPESAERNIRHDIVKLRRKIKWELGMPYLPPLHMRLMWGDRIPQKKNDYFTYGATKEQRARWVKHGYDIIYKYIRLNQLKVTGVSLEISQVQDVLLLYANDPETQKEYEFIKRHFPKATKPFYDVMLNPLVRLIMNLVAAGDYHCRQTGNRLSVFYDTSEASKGFTTMEGMKVLRQVRRFESIDSINEHSSEDDLMQLADLVAYRIFRGRLMRYRLQKGRSDHRDVGLDAALRNRSMNDGGLEIPRGLRLESYHESLFAMLQTAYAAENIRRLYPESADTYLLPLSAYNVNVDEHDTLTGFFPAVDPRILSRWEMARGRLE